MVSKNMIRIYGAVVVLLIMFSTHAVFSKVNLTPPVPIDAPQTIHAAGTIEIGFSPNGGITDMIVKEIDTAKSSIEVQANSFQAHR